MQCEAKSRRHAERERSIWSRAKQASQFFGQILRGGSEWTVLKAEHPNADS
jgi:hypothetical protein